MICKLVGLIKAARIGLARFTYSSSHTCAYDYVIELARFFGYYHLLCVPFMHDACFHKAGKSVLYKLICLVTANAGLAKHFDEVILVLSVHQRPRIQNLEYIWVVHRYILYNIPDELAHQACHARLLQRQQISSATKIHAPERINLSTSAAICAAVRELNRRAVAPP